MKKLSEYQNEEAIDLLADILDPVAMILGDKKVQTLIKSNVPKLKIVQHLLKNHSKEVVKVLARLEGKKVSEYKCNILTLPKVMLEIMDDEELVNFFQSQVQSSDVSASTSATANIKETEAK